MMRLSLNWTLAVVALALAAPASASVTVVPASSGQGTLVHNTGAEQVSTELIANLGQPGPNIVHFTGDTNATSSLVDYLRMQQGQGQADITGALITKKDYSDIISGNIFLTNHVGMNYIELALTGTTSGSVDFVISSMLNGVTQADSLFHLVLGSGDNHFAFLATAGSAITNVHYGVGAGPDNTYLPTGFTDLKQVRIDQSVPAVPEPATWAMMLLGFGAMGTALRRGRRQKLGNLHIA